MHEPEAISLEDGSVINPRHFIYLDRSRLFSYTAQVSDGLPQLRSLLETVSRSVVDTPIERYSEENQELLNEVDGSIGPKGFAGGLSGKRSHQRSHKKGVKESGATNKYESMQILAEHKAEHDNLYLLLEQELIDVGLLHEVNETLIPQQCPRLIKVTGTARFFDWDSVLRFMEEPDDVWNCFDHNTRQAWGNDKKKMRGLAQLIRVFSLGPLTLNMQLGSISMSASLNPKHLCMSIHQLRAAYVMPGDVEITVVGFTPKRPSKLANFPGIAGQMNMGEMWAALAGEVDLVIDPVAIYGESL